ncbi:L-fuculose-phosphate aldolase [Paraburkholderia sp. SARCC-3016]|uniref:L-fuculose-phosphate aldolase n=1 Tax=Paraburkholderia sp. SARCC-3016 TaxID=3058611 RepID=UPI002809F7FF|nr:L-fuculose-phosphate aldolase [Paraburkholderia sp. SARCC-3016]MDQ7979488.1 L-fuculose-phosphate aldolase [Paraburkholderia sp. SARCC-3016]
MNEHELNQRQSIIDACRRMNALGVNQGTSGNISVRHEHGMLVTPTSMPYDAMEPDDIVYMTMDGEAQGKRQPSSEWRFHLDILRARADVNAVVHTHPPYCTSLSILERPIPPIHYMVAVAGGSDIRCAPYATFGTEELSANALVALEGRKACLLAHHGMIATGTTLDKAMWLTVEVETLARQYLTCLQVEEPPLLSVAEIDNVIARMGNYGHRD